MSTKSRPSELIQAALEDDLVPLGGYDIRPDGDSCYRTAYPKLAAQINGLDDSDSVRMWVDQDTGAVVIIPVEALDDD